MDKIIGISEDELLVKILSFLPTKDAVSTGVLSKQWKYLWKRVQKLDYDDTHIKTKPSRFRRFVKSNLLIDRESDLESLSLKFSTRPFQVEDIYSWVRFAVSRGVRHLSIAYSSDKEWYTPIYLFTCKSLVSLKLEGQISVSCQDFLQWVRSNCPVLENLTLKIINKKRDSTEELSINVPSLQSLSVEIDGESDFDGYLEEAYIDVVSPNTKKLLEPIASVKRLLLCLTVNSAQPNATFLILKEHSPISRTPMVNWKNQLSCVPQCIVTSLETFKWIGCEGRQEEIDVVAYILNNAPCLKTATVLADESKIDPQRKIEMINELVSSSLASATCKLTLNGSFAE
ncbi:PREDICTED: putative FBD-associated F-box protein At5g56410 [Camelina sativa]|uniref:FBD-associated F-box protein At5g56410 n=1 Tax=Camelina sativa TaxID=90675 RepID=A0ABM0WV42_CAMSA|nr:PREDICTED: putative FBD-associated F-box protein At5g56410 [Camelina sativa]